MRAGDVQPALPKRMAVRGTQAEGDVESGNFFCNTEAAKYLNADENGYSGRGRGK